MLLQSRFVDLPDADSALAQLFIRELFTAGNEQVRVAALRNFACRVRLSEREGLVFGERLLHLSGLRELRGRALETWGERVRRLREYYNPQAPGASALD